MKKIVLSLVCAACSMVAAQAQTNNTCKSACNKAKTIVVCQCKADGKTCAKTCNAKTGCTCAETKGKCCKKNACKGNVCKKNACKGNVCKKSTCCKKECKGTACKAENKCEGCCKAKE